MHRKILFIGILLFVSGMTPALACKKAQAAEPTMTQEQRGQFLYHWYDAKMAIEQEQYDKALALLTFCEHLCPTDAQTHEYLGLIYEALNDSEASMEHFRLAYTYAPYDLWRNYANLLMATRGQEKAVRKQVCSMLEDITRQRPKDENAWDFLRQVYTHNEQWNKALRAQDKLDALVGYDGNSALHRYQIYVQRGKPVHAIAAIDDYLEFDPANLQFRLFRIQLLEYTHAPWPTMAEAYQQFLLYDPSNLMIMNNYAYGIAIHGGDLREAERLSQRTIQAEPNNPIYLDTYAWILHLQGQDTLAAFYIRKATANIGEGENDHELNEHYNIIINGAK